MGFGSSNCREDYARFRRRLEAPLTSVRQVLENAFDVLACSQAIHAVILAGTGIDVLSQAPYLNGVGMIPLGRIDHECSKEGFIVLVNACDMGCIFLCTSSSQLDALCICRKHRVHSFLRLDLLCVF